MKVFDIPSAALNTFERLENAGYKAYFAGGCVRDMLLGQTPSDYDLATSAVPDEVTALFSDLKVAPTGIRHGTVTVVNDGLAIEVTTFRRDGAYLDHRRPSAVEFSSSPAEDAARRDFTVNAMFYNPRLGLLDFFNGRADIERRLIRCVGKADFRFEEDALRILRALRFAARLGFVIEESTSEAMYKNAFLLREISAERIFSELCGFFGSDGCARLCAEYAELFAPLLGEAYAPLRDFGVLGALSARFRPAAFFALYGGADGALGIAARLKADKATVSLTAAAVDAAYGGRLLSVEGLVSAVRAYGEDTLTDMLAFAAALGRKTCETAGEILSLLRRGRLPRTPSGLAVNGRELEALGFAREGIGKELDRLLADVYRGAPNEKPALLKAAADHLINGGTR